MFIAAIVVCASVAVFAQQAPDRSHPPQPGPPPPLHLPTIQKQKLSNGLPVWIVELHEVPVAQVNLVVLSGTANDPPGKYGVASLTAAMLEEGAGSRSALEIADAVDYLGADLGAATTSISSAVRLHVPVARLADALPIMADVALRPTFPKDELERQRQQRLTSLLQGRDDPPTISAVAFSRVLYGKGHRYGTRADGHRGNDQDVHRRRSARRSTPARSVRRTRPCSPSATSPPTRRCRCSRRASARGRRPARAAAEKLPPTDEPPARQIYLIDKPGAPQSQIRIGRIGVPRSTPDYFPLQVLNTILGGSFTSRLNNNLREEHGYTYGAGSVVRHARRAPARSTPRPACRPTRPPKR